MPRKPGRPKIPANEKIKITNISVPKEVHEEFSEYRRQLSDQLGVELTVSQTVKYLIRNARL